MSQDSIIWCPSCGAGYRWRSDAADRRFPCSCGAVFHVPARPSNPVYLAQPNPPARAPSGDLTVEEDPPLGPDGLERVASKDEAEDETGEYSLATPPPPPRPAAPPPPPPQAAAPRAAERGEEPDEIAPPPMVRCSNCQTWTDAQARLCMRCGNPLTGKEVTEAESQILAVPSVASAHAFSAYSDSETQAPPETHVARVRRKIEDIEAEQLKFAAEARLLDYQLPIGMIFLSLVLMFFAAGIGATNISQAIIQMSLLASAGALLFPIYVLCLLVTASIVQQSYGELRVVILKLLALAFFPGTVAALVAALAMTQLGFTGQIPLVFDIVRIIVAAGLFWYCSRTLFRLEFVESLAFAAVFSTTGAIIRLLLVVAAHRLGFI